MRSIVILISFALLIHACRMQTEDTDRVTEIKKIEELRRRDMVAAKAGDYETLRSLFTTDAVMIPPASPPIQGAESLEQHFQFMEESMRGIEILEYEIEIEELIIAGDYAFEWGAIRGKSRNAENEIQEASYNVVRILKKSVDGEWKIYCSIWNSKY